MNEGAQYAIIIDGKIKSHRDLRETEIFDQLPSVLVEGADRLVNPCELHAQSQW
jgi:hypothetical protein